MSRSGRGPRVMRQKAWRCVLALFVLPLLLAEPSRGQVPEHRVRPGLSVQAALDEARPGDRVVLLPGVHYGRVTVPSGVILAGVRGPTGEWHSVLDGSDPVTARWVPAPDIGRGVWKTLAFPYTPYAMQHDTAACLPDRLDMQHCSRTIFRIGSDAMDGNGIFGPGGSQDHYAGWVILAHPADYRYRPYSSVRETVPFWDGVEALFGVRGGVTYLRFRHGDDPNTLRLRSSPGPSCQFCLPSVGTVMLMGTTQSTVQDLAIRGGRNAVLVSGGSGHIIERCHLTGGQVRVRVDQGAAQTIIRNNLMHKHAISPHVAGARTESTTYAPLSRVLNWHVYMMGKNPIGDSAGDERGIWLFQSGAGTLIEGNTIDGGHSGIDVAEGRQNQAIIRGNTLRYQAGQGLLTLRVQELTIYNNTFIDNAIGIRVQGVQEGAQRLHIYRNRFWSPYGEQMFFHGEGRSEMRLILAHNSFSAPTRMEIPGSTASDRVAHLVFSGYITSASTFLVLNNIFGDMRNEAIYVLPHERLYSNLMPKGYLRPGNTAYDPKPWGDALPSNWEAPPQARDVAAPLPPEVAALPGMSNRLCGSGPDLGASEYCVETSPQVHAPTRLRLR